MEKIVRKLVCDAGKRLVESGLSQGTWGNVSMRLDEKHMVITPSGRDYMMLTPEDMVVVDINTLEWEGLSKPSSESGLHAEIYKTRIKVNGIIHTHPQECCTVAAARVEVPPILDDMVQIIGPTARVADYALPGTKKMIKAVIKALAGRNGCLLANHGAVCTGRTLDEAFTANIVLEKACKAFIEASFLGGAKPLGRIDAKLIYEVYKRKYSCADQDEKLKALGIEYSDSRRKKK